MSSWIGSASLYLSSHKVLLSVPSVGLNVIRKERVEGGN